MGGVDLHDSLPGLHSGKPKNRKMVPYDFLAHDRWSGIGKRVSS